MSLVQEFKDFALKGNMVDMAVGIIVGGAFGKIIGSLVNDIIMPPIGYMMGGTDFSNLKITLQQASEGVDAVTINWGSFVQTSLDFAILAAAIFAMIKVMNNLKKKEEEAPAAPPVQEELLREIRDALKK